MIVGAGEVGAAGFVESDCEKAEIKVRHTIAPKKIFLNIVLDLKINNERGVTDQLFSEVYRSATLLSFFGLKHQ